MNVRLLHIADCPNTAATLRLLRECLVQEQATEIVSVLEIKNEAEAWEHRFLGSPSIQIDGEDIELTRRSDAPFIGCRIYNPGAPDPGVPSRQLLLEGIRRARA